MVEQKIELRKVRDLGDNINDTFLFIKQNLKSLLICFLCLAGVFMLLAAIYGGLYKKDTGTLFQQIFSRGGIESARTEVMFGLNFFLVIIFSWINIVAMQVAVIAYVKFVELHEGAKPTIDQVFKIFISYLPAMVIYNLIVGIVIGIGFALCILPGIYLLVVLTPFTCIIMLENKSFGSAFSRCFELIKNNFWISLGLYLLVYIIYAFSATIISAVVGGLTGLLYYFTTKDLNATVEIVSSILNVFSFVFYIIYSVSVILHYFNLAEIKDGIGMMRKVNSIGDNNTSFDNIQEQY